MKRHGDDLANKNKRFSFSNDSRPPPQQSPQSSSYYSYSSPMWVDPRTDPKNHPNMNMFQPQSMMMSWSNPANAAIYNPLQPPPPLPLERPPLDTPPPPPPHNHSMPPRRNLSLNNNMRRRPPNSLRPDQQG